MEGLDGEAAAAAAAPLPPPVVPPLPTKSFSADDCVEEATELYTTAEMRQHCMRQIARYQRVLQVIDQHPDLFPAAEELTAGAALNF